MYVVPTHVDKKIGTLLILMGITLLIIVGRLFHLQIYLTHTLFTQSQKNFLRTEKKHSPRGNILDVNGQLLATNRPTNNVYWHGTGNRSLDETQMQTLKNLGSILGNELVRDTTITQVKNVERRYKKLLLASDISFEQLSQIKEQFPEHGNITIDTHFERYYPHASIASHILGYLGNVTLEASGKMGLEKKFQDILQGKSGTILKTTNSLGRQINQTQVQQALAGTNIQTTIDIDVQLIAERVFPHDKSGAFIVMNPEDGALRAVVSRPAFDPSTFLQPISHEKWQALQEKKPFLNRAFNTSYPPGSIFKLITVSAALEHGILHHDDTINCKGFIYFCGRKYWCARRNGHGEITIMQALAHSCNSLFFEIAKKINIDLLTDYAHKFGLGTKTDLLLPEKNGLIPSTQWKRDVKGERWWPGETLSVAIGQSFLLVTPIQIARMVGSIFTGYLVSPRILVNEPVYQEPLNLSLDTRDFLQKSMKQVVRSGTGRRMNTLKDIELYAKTSTAQISDFKKRKLGNEYLEHGWMVTYFRYKESTPLVIISMIENVGSSRPATNTVKSFLIEYKKLLDKHYESYA